VEPAREGRHAAWPAGLHPLVVRACARVGVTAPYEHQAETMDHVLASRDVVLVSPTASGKTLAFVAPIVSECVADADARALLLFPTKALALDQVARLEALLGALEACAVGEGLAIPDVPVSTFDGDTPADARRAVRRRGRIVVTNPDMLHAGILPQHVRWAQLFQGLRFVVVDELHAYRGVFGSHVANVLRRLLRVAAFHGSRPRFILCSATIANAREHAERLVGRPVEVVDRCTAPRAERHLVLYNPPLVDARLGLRGSVVGAVRRLATDALDAGLHAIVFARSRLTVEILTKYLKEGLAWTRRDARLVEGYRGGYLPRTRHATQERLKGGDLQAVVATSALELGLDIGELDVAITCGWPGSIASTWQQWGRAGRSGAPALCVLVASSHPVDQHVVEHPEYFFGRSPEHVRTDPDNLLVVAAHARCAAFELPFRGGDVFGALGPEATAELLGLFAAEGFLHREGETWHWAHETHPAASVSLRNASEDNFVVVDVSPPAHRVIAEVDFASAYATLHEQAVYMAGARPHQVERLDHENRKAFVRPVDCDHYTQAVTHQAVAVLESFGAATVGRSAPAGPGASGGPVGLAGHGEVRVSRKVVGFKKIRFYTLENVGYGEVALPEVDLHTTAAWLTLTAQGLHAVAALAGGASRRAIVDAMAGAARAVHAVATLHASCDGRDLGLAMGDARGSGAGGAQPDDDTHEPTMFLHETVAGGTGLAPLLFDLREDLVAGARGLVARCSCDEGCPSCVGPPGELGAGSKRLAQAILEALAPRGHDR
jgi:DEAD/DEAH box helicase domain-containing protein